MRFSLDEFLQRWDPDGTVLTRSAGVIIGTLITAGIVTSVANLRGPNSTSNLGELEARLDQVQTATADFDIVRVNYFEDRRGGHLGFQLYVRKMTEQCLHEALVVDVLVKVNQNTNLQLGQWKLSPNEEEKYGSYLEIPIGKLDQGAYVLSVSPCGGGAPSKLAEFVVAGGTPP